LLLIRRSARKTCRWLKQQQNCNASDRYSRCWSLTHCRDVSLLGFFLGSRIDVENVLQYSRVLHHYHFRIFRSTGTGMSDLSVQVVQKIEYCTKSVLNVCHTSQSHEQINWCSLHHSCSHALCALQIVYELLQDVT
jgi:hypothetical protein